MRVSSMHIRPAIVHTCAHFLVDSTIQPAPSLALGNTLEHKTSSGRTMTLPLTLAGPSSFYSMKHSQLCLIACHVNAISKQIYHISRSSHNHEIVVS